MHSALPHFSFFLIFFSAMQCKATLSQYPILDTTGKVVRQGVNYYIKAVKQDLGLGLNLASIGNHTCPLGVVQTEPYDGGIPVTFYPLNPKKHIVRGWTDTNIGFSEGYVSEESRDACPGYSSFWRVDHYRWPRISNETRYIVNGGVRGNPGRDTIGNWFQIVKSSEGYFLTFCPSMCDDCEDICDNVGIVVKDGQRRLAVTDDAFPFKLERI